MCVGRGKRLLFCSCDGGVLRASSSFLPLSGRDSAQLAERGSGLEKEVKLRGGVCRLRKGVERKGGKN